MRSTLLVTSGASITSSASYAVFTRALAGALVTSFSGSADRMAVTRCNTQHAK